MLNTPERWTIIVEMLEYAQHLLNHLLNTCSTLAQHLLDTCSTLAQHFYHIFSGTSSVEQVLSRKCSTLRCVDQVFARASSKTLLLHVLHTCSTQLDTTGAPNIPEMRPEENYRSEMHKRALKTVQSWICEKLPARPVPKQCCWVQVVLQV